MKTSNLAECLAEFEATILAAVVSREKPARPMAAGECGAPPRAPRRLSLESRRIQIRDTGLPQFRVF